MRIGALNSTNDVNFGLKVTIDKKICQLANKEEAEIIKNLKHELSRIRMDGDVFFKAIQDSEGIIVNIAHTENEIPLPPLYKKNKPLVIKEFIDFLKQLRESYESRFISEREVYDAFGDRFI